MDLTSVSQGVHTRKLKKRVGRGTGSGHGKTATRGHKGQYASAGAGLPKSTFAGGQTPIHRRIPKRGFTNATFAKEYAIVNIGDFDAFDAGATIDVASLKEKRIVNGTYDGLRVLGNGEVTKAFKITAHHFTKGARAKLEAVGCTVTVIEPPKKPVRNKMGSRKKALEAERGPKLAKSVV